MSEETTENETLGGVLVNGLGGRESPGVGVSGSKPLVNGDLREGDSEGEYEGRQTTVLTDGVGDSSTSSSAGKQREVAVKVSTVIRSTIACRRVDLGGVGSAHIVRVGVGSGITVVWLV